MNDIASYEQLIEQGLAASRNELAAEAIASFEQAGALAPGSGMPHFLIGSELAGRGDVEAAEHAFARAILLAPGFHLARYQLGLLQFSAGRASAALVTWQPLHDLPETECMVHFIGGFAALAAERLDDALARFRRGLEQPGGHEALIPDIRSVIEAIEHLLARTKPAPGRVPAEHVLLSGYARGMH
jgi:Flp pilus assembly protein TadD